MGSLDELAIKLEETSELDKLAKKVDSNALLVKELLHRAGLSRQLEDLNIALKDYTKTPVQSQVDIEIIAKYCENHGYNDLGKRVNELAKSLDDVAKIKY